MKTKKNYNPDSKKRGWLAAGALFLFFAGVLVGTIFICRHHYDKLDQQLAQSQSVQTYSPDLRAGGRLANGQYAAMLPTSQYPSVVPAGAQYQEVLPVIIVKGYASQGKMLPENYIYYFPNAGSEVAGNTALENLAGLIAQSGANVAVTGYTDPVGNAAYNNKLSEARAQHLAQYLEAHGVAPDHVTVKNGGVTSAYPSYALDRRGEIIISY